MAEVVEQKPIGIPIGTDGTFSNTEFKNGAIQIKASSQEPLEYYPMGLWTSNIVNIGDSFKDFGKIILTVTNKNGSKVEISTRTSADGVSFSIWQKTTEDGSIMSPKNKFLQVRLTLYAGATISKIDITNDEYIENNEFVESVVYQNGKYITPTLTSNTSSPLGFAFASSEAPTYGAWRAFDKVNSNRYQTIDGQHLNGYVGFAFNTESFSIEKYMVRSSPTTALTYNIKDWTIEGSNNTTNGTDGIWDTLDTQANQTWSSPNQDKIFNIPKTKPYKAFRLRWTANNGHTTQTMIGELDFFSAPVENIQLKRDYKFDMTQDSTWSDTGSLHRKDIIDNEWLKIDKLEPSDIDSKPPVKIDITTMSDSSVITNDNTIEKGVARADTPRNKGKVYFEGKYLSDNYNIIGICLREFNPKTYIMSSLSPSINMWTFENARGIMQYDNKFNNPYTTGTTILSTVGVGVDLDLGKLEFFVNGVSKGIAPVSIPTGKDIFPLIGLATGGKATLNFGATPFEYGLPTGYEAWQKKETNKTFILSNGEYKKFSPERDATQDTYTSNLIPIMTSNISPSGTAFTSSFDGAGYEAWRAFNNSLTDFHQNVAWAYPYNLGYIFANNNRKKIKMFSVTAEQAINMFTSFTLQGSNNTTTGQDGTWSDIASYSSLTWTNNEKKSFILETEVEYYAYRLLINTGSRSAYSTVNFALYGILTQGSPASPARWETISTTLPTQTQFLEQGMDSLSPLLDRKVTTLEPMNMTDKSEILNGETGKVFSNTIDLKKYFDIRSIRMEEK